jgi:hypothetical protein
VKIDEVYGVVFICDGKPADLLVLWALARRVANKRKFFVIVNGRNYESTKFRRDFFATCVDVLRRDTDLDVSVHIGDAHTEDTMMGVHVWRDIGRLAANAPHSSGIVVIHTSKFSGLPAAIVLAQLADDDAHGRVGVVTTMNAKPLCANYAIPVRCACIVVVDEQKLCGDGVEINVYDHENLFDDVVWPMSDGMASAFLGLVTVDNVDSVASKMMEYRELLAKSGKEKQSAEITNIVTSLFAIRASEIANVATYSSGMFGVTTHIPPLSTVGVRGLYMQYTKENVCTDFRAKDMVDDIVPVLDRTFSMGSTTVYGVVAAMLKPTHPTYTAAGSRLVKCADPEIRAKHVGEDNQQHVYTLVSDKSDTDMVRAHVMDLAACAKFEL